MQSDVTKILNILGEETTFVPNGFSSSYNFSTQKVEEYFQELLSNAEETPIFSGIIILQKQTLRYNNVDGLQRLTTIYILLSALCDVLKNLSDNDKKLEEEIRYKYLIGN